MPHVQTQVERSVILVTIVIAGLMACTFDQGPAAGMLGPIPNSAELLEQRTVVHGFDVTHVFLFSTTDTQLRDALVDKWKLRELTNDEEGPVSFARNDYPDNYPWWWPSEWPSGTRSYGRSCDKEEYYWSLWETANSRRLFVEIGRW